MKCEIDALYEGCDLKNAHFVASCGVSVFLFDFSLLVKCHIFSALSITQVKCLCLLSPSSLTPPGAGQQIGRLESRFAAYL